MKNIIIVLALFLSNCASNPKEQPIFNGDAYQLSYVDDYNLIHTFNAVEYPQQHYSHQHTIDRVFKHQVGTDYTFEVWTTQDSTGRVTEQQGWIYHKGFKIKNDSIHFMYGPSYPCTWKIK